MIDKQYAYNQHPLVLSLLSGKVIATEKPPIPLSYLTLAESDSGYYEFQEEKPIEETIMRMDITGPILKYGGYCSYGTMDYIDWIRNANNDDSISALLITVDSPGGQASGIELLRDAIASSQKPVAVQIVGLAASAAAYSIVSADRIYASSDVDTIGSYGGMITWTDYSAYLKKNGIKVHTVYAPQSTHKNFEATEAEKGNYKPLEEKLKTLIDYHHAAVTKYREPSSDAWEDGKTFFATDALEWGLIDGIQSIDETMNELLSLIQTNNNSSQMFNKHKKLSALAGVAEADLTEAQVDDVNAELDSLQLSAVRVVPASFVADADNAIAEKNVALKAQKDAEAALTAMTADRDNWKAKAESYGNQPGDKPTQLEKKNETVKSTDAPTPISQTDKELMELQGKTFVVVD